jgi:hypothetical protein
MLSRISFGWVMGRLGVGRSIASGIVRDRSGLLWNWRSWEEIFIFRNYWNWSCITERQIFSLLEFCFLSGVVGCG